MQLDTIYNEDCLEGIPKRLSNNSIDLVLTDPPFFMPSTHYQSRVNWQRNFGDLTPLKVFWAKVIELSVRVMKPTAHLLVFCNCDSYPVFYEPTYNYFDKLKSLVWNKTRVGLGRIFRNQHELLIWARWKESKYINDGRLRSDVLSFPATLSAKREHPVEKPILLLKELIEPLTNEGDIVLDMFAGSGTTLQATKELGRHYIGFEINPEYCEIAKKRLENLQLKLC